MTTTKTNGWKKSEREKEPPPLMKTFEAENGEKRRDNARKEGKKRSYRENKKK